MAKPSQSKAGNRCNTQDQNSRKQGGAKGGGNNHPNAATNTMRSTGKRGDDALGNAMTTMQGTFISGKTKPQQLGGISLKDEKDVVRDTEMEFRRRQGFKRIFPSIDYAYYKQFFVKERNANALLD